MFLAPRQRKTTVFTRFWASASKNHGIYSVLWPGKLGKIDKKSTKNAQQGPPKRIFEFYLLFFPTPNPEKRESPSRPKDFRGGSAAGARPRVAKAMLSFHHKRRGIAGFKRLRATAGQGPNYVGPLWLILWLSVGLCWRMLAYLAGNVGPSCGYVGLCWPHVDPCWAKRSEKWEQQKHTVKRRIFWWSAAYLGAMLAHLGAMLAQLGAMVPHLGAMLAHLGGYVGPSWGYVGPSWSLCWPMLTHREPQEPKKCKKGKSTKHRKTRDFLAVRAWSAAGAAAPLSYGEERTAVRLCHGQADPGKTRENVLQKTGNFGSVRRFEVLSKTKFFSRIACEHVCILVLLLLEVWLGAQPLSFCNDNRSIMLLNHEP